MKYKYVILFLLLTVGLAGCNKKIEISRMVSFDEQWLFHYGDVEDGEKKMLDDSQWRKLDIPHDWTIEDIPGTTSPFDSTVVNGVSSGFTRGGIGWYRKHFVVDESQLGKRFYIRFDGVYMNVDVWVNEQYVGNQYYGYSTFGYDITDFIKPGETNLVAVQVKTEAVTSRWYSGSGIYRHVWLVATSPLCIDNYGTVITTPLVSDQKADVVITSTLVNYTGKDTKAVVRQKIVDKDKKIVAQGEKECKIRKREKVAVTQNLTVVHPLSWSVDSPNLYSLVTEVIQDGDRMDLSLIHI